MCLFPLCLIAVAAFAVEKPAFRQPTDVWAGIPSHPAVVNHVSVEKFGRDANNISLAGEWDVVKFAHGSGVRTVRPEKDLWAKDAKKVTVGEESKSEK